jgi:uncharacterized membrane protein YhaH (DUF805 family)
VGDFFSFSGHVNRPLYWALSIIFFIYSVLIGFLSFSLVGTGHEIAGSLLFIVCYGSLIYSGISISVRRCRDAGLSPWLCVLLFAPFINVLFSILIGCLPSSVTASKPGDALEPKNPPPISEGFSMGAASDTLMAVEQLATLHAKGLITDDEFSNHKNRVLEAGYRTNAATPTFAGGEPANATVFNAYKVIPATDHNREATGISASAEQNKCYRKEGQSSLFTKTIFGLGLGLLVCAAGIPLFFSSPSGSACSSRGTYETAEQIYSRFTEVASIRDAKEVARNRKTATSICRATLTQTNGVTINIKYTVQDLGNGEAWIEAQAAD